LLEGQTNEEERTMKRLKFWIAGMVAVLAASSIAMAAGGAATETPSATFNAAAKRVVTKNCTGSDGSYTITHGRYEGTMTSTNPALNGRVRLEVHSVYNNDEKAGWMRGELRVAGDDSRAAAVFSAVNLDGNVEGLLIGRAGKPRAGLLANFSATFGTGGFTDGKLGTGASGNEALLFNRGCVRDDDDGKVSLPARGEKPKDGADRPQEPVQQPKERSRK
jgi:hypothetical protein